MTLTLLQNYRGNRKYIFTGSFSDALMADFNGAYFYLQQVTRQGTNLYMVLDVISIDSFSMASPIESS